jgi:glycosyltransferase involved in cell wall biosynthesis
VLGDIPSQCEIWGDAALYVDVDDETALAHTINGLIDSPELLQHYQSKAIKRCGQFSSDVMSKEYRLVYNNIIQQSITKKQQVV